MSIALHVTRARTSTARVGRQLALWLRERSRHFSWWPAVHVTLLSMLVLGGFAYVAAEHRSAERKLAEKRTLEMSALSLPDAGGVFLSLGDRLKITFFERIAAAAGDAHPGQVQPPSIVERVELTGEYMVHEDGNIFLPLFGQTPVAGKTLQQVQAAMQGAFKEMFGRDARVSLAFIEREPVYIVGPVTRPGTYKYTPSMTVLHAIALAGGLESTAADVSQFLETMRENERLQKSVVRLRKLLVRSTVLKTERTEGAGAPEISTRLLDLASHSEAEGLIAEVVSLRKLSAEGRQARLSALDATIASAKQELHALRTRIEHIQSNIANKSERLNVVRSLQQRGATGGFNVYQARSDFADIQERLQDAMAAIAQTEQRRAQAEHEKLKVTVEAQIELERDLAATEIEIADAEVTMLTSRHVLKAITKPTYNLPTTRPNVSYEIVRRSVPGVQDVPASEASLLQPGDLVRVRGY